MELGQTQLQIFISLVVILIAALVALICDFLKGNNEQLRELAIELKVSRDQERRLVQLLTAPQAEIAEEVVAELPKVPISLAPPAPPPEAAPVAATKNWGAVLARGAEAARSGFPRGFQTPQALTRLSRREVSGLVVSIGVNGSISDAVRHLVRSLIGPNDFACQSEDDEFVLIYPGESGASAQRRLSEISQQLWNFQLGTMGTFSIVFSWGGVEVRNESVEEAVASASERMQETRRGRKLLMIREPLKQAV